MGFERAENSLLAEIQSQFCNKIRKFNCKIIALHCIVSCKEKKGE